MFRRLAASIAFVFAASPVLAAPAAPTAPVTAATLPAAEQVVRAAQTGDRVLMQRLTGTHFSLRGKAAQPLRSTETFRDFVIVTGPSFRLGDIPTGFEFVLRVPRNLALRGLPDLIETSGTVAGWEETSHQQGVPGRVAWRPIISIDLFK